MKNLEETLPKTAPGKILSDNFIGKLELAIKSIGQATSVNPFGMAAGFVAIGLAAAFTVLAVIGRLDLLPLMIGALVRIVGGA